MTKTEMRDHNEIIKAAYRAMKANQRGIRGQTIDPQDSIEWWIADTALQGPCIACESTAKANDYLKKQCDYKDDIINQLTDERVQYLHENKKLREELDDYDLIACDGCGGYFETAEIVGDGYLQCDGCSEIVRLQATIEKMEKDNEPM